MVHELKAKLRKEKEADRLLAVVYGPEIKENKLISLHPVEFGKLYEAAGESSIINLAIEGEAKSREVLIKAVDYTPVRDIIRHVDFYQIKAGQKLEVEVELNFVDESSAVKDLGGILVTNMDKLKIRCLAKDMISELKVSLSALKALNDRIVVKDLVIPDGIEVLSNPGEVIAIVATPEEEKVEEAAQSATPVEGAAAPAGGAAAPAAGDAAKAAEPKKSK